MKISLHEVRAEAHAMHQVDEDGISVDLPRCGVFVKAIVDDIDDEAAAKRQLEAACKGLEVKVHQLLGLRVTFAVIGIKNNVRIQLTPKAMVAYGNKIVDQINEQLGN